MLRRIRVPFVIALLLGTGLVAPAEAASASTSSTPIVVGGDGNLAVSAGVAQGFIAGIKRFNDAGGLDGRKIDFVGFLDDGFSPQTNLTNAQELVESKHVTVVAPFLSEINTPATATYLAKAKVPFIGWAVSSGFTSDPKWGWGITGLQDNPNAQSIAGIQQLLEFTHNAKTPSKLKVALIGENNASVIATIDALKGDDEYAKTSVVYSGTPMAVIGTTNYAPYAQTIISSGANEVTEVLDAADAVGLAAALKSAGYKGIIMNGTTYLPGQLASQPSEAAALNGVLVEDEFPADENNTPATKQAIKDLEATGQAPYLSTGVSVGYWSAILLEQMLKATLAKVGGDPDKVTGTTIDSTVNSGFTYAPPLAGGISTMYFPAEETLPTGCLTLLKVSGTTYKQVYPYQCEGVANLAKGRSYNLKTGK